MQPQNQPENQNNTIHEPTAPITPNPKPAVTRPTTDPLQKKYLNYLLSAIISFFIAPIIAVIARDVLPADATIIGTIINIIVALLILWGIIGFPIFLYRVIKITR